MKYTPIIGLEIHVELKTQQKMFCGCDANHFRVEANTHTCPVCLGLPGALPVPNKTAIEYAQMVGLALNCKLARESKFDRKHYFYPDLPKSYQISQYDQPLNYDGFLTLKNGKKMGIIRAHLEEDTGKNIHKTINGKHTTLIDFNRSCVPLLEIVTGADFRNEDDVDEFLKLTRQVIRYLGVSDCDMEKGSMRLEVNMSLGTDENFNADGTIKQFPKYKVEVKNINSFRFVKKAIAYEYNRQAQILDMGNLPVQETRGYQEDVDKTISQREKVDAAEYRYFPEPDIPPMIFTEEELQTVASKMPQLPWEKEAKFKGEYKLSDELAEFLTATRELADYFEKTLAADSQHKLEAIKIANAIKNKKVDWQTQTPEAVVEQLLQSSQTVEVDMAEVEKVVSDVLASNPQLVEQYKSGKVAVLGFFIGTCMKSLQGKSDANSIKKALLERL